MNIESKKGVWKTGVGKGKKKSRGRQALDKNLKEISDLISNRPLRRDLLIEYLHLIQDKYGHISVLHISALAEIMKLAQAEVYEVATFYAHFDVIHEGETPPPKVTIRVCDSLSCELNSKRYFCI